MMLVISTVSRQQEVLARRWHNRGISLDCISQHLGVSKGYLKMVLRVK